jgi:hypothetical protein
VCLKRVHELILNKIKIKEKGDALSPLLFNCALALAIRRVQEN